MKRILLLIGLVVCVSSCQNEYKTKYLQLLQENSRLINQNDSLKKAMNILLKDIRALTDDIPLEFEEPQITIEEEKKGPNKEVVGKWKVEFPMFNQTVHIEIVKENGLYYEYMNGEKSRRLERKSNIFYYLEDDGKRDPLGGHVIWGADGLLRTFDNEGFIEDWTGYPEK